jgi:uncharacterized membrane protein
MSGAQIHLVFNHFPLLFSFIALLMLIYGIYKKQTILIKAGLILNIGAFFFTFPMFFSGEMAEETVEHMEHVSHDYIHEHEEMAEKAFAFSFILVIVSAAALFNFPSRFSSILPVIAVAVSVIAFLLYSLTAHLGGRVSHPELREADKAVKENME